MFAKRILCGVLLAAFIASSTPLWMPDALPTAHAKAKKGTAKTLTKDWAELEPKYKSLMGKVQTHMLFTPEDGKALEELAQASQSLQAKYAKIVEFAPILYNMGVLFKARELYFESYDAFQGVVEHYDGTPYARKARFQLATLKKEMGDDAKMFDAAAASPTTRDGSTPPPLKAKK